MNTSLMNSRATIIRLNGQERETSAATVAELLEELQAPQSGVAVAVNRKVIRRHEQATVALAPGDDVELIRAVQGG